MKSIEQPYNLPTIPHLAEVLMLAFFAGGITLSTGIGGVYLPFVLFLIVPALILFPGFVRISRLNGPYLLLALTLLISSLVLNFQSDNLRQLGGLQIILLGWLGLLCGSTISLPRGNALAIGGVVLFASIFLIFASAFADGSLQLDFAYLIFPTSDYTFKNELATLFGGSNYLAAFMLFFVGYAGISRKLPLLVLSVAGVYLTLSKAAIGLMALFLLVLVLDFVLRRWLPRLTAGKRVASIATIIAPLAFFYTQYLFGMASLNNDVRVLTLTQRTRLWEDGWEMIMDKPIFGNGYGSMVNLDGIWSIHNGLLDYWLSYGIFAMLMFMVFVFFVLRKFYIVAQHPVNQEERLVSFGVLAGLGLMLVHGMVEPLFLNTQFLIFLGLLAGGVRPFSRPKVPAAPRVLARSALQRTQSWKS